jgi:hypothetical protein
LQRVHPDSDRPPVVSPEMQLAGNTHSGR